MPLVDLATEPSNEDLRPEGRRRFVMLFVGRTGSSFTVDVLNQHPQIRFEGERLQTFLRAEYPAKEQRAWLEELWSAESMAQHQVVGFKTKSFDIPDLAGFRATLGRIRPTLLVSERRDLLKQVISAERAKARAGRLEAELGPQKWKEVGGTARAWNVAAGDDGLEAIRVEPKAVLANLEWIESAVVLERLLVDNLALTYGVDVVRYDYQELLDNGERFFERLFRLLGVEPIEFEHRFRKHTPDDLTAAITNYEEIVAAVRNTPFERFARDALTA